MPKDVKKSILFISPSHDKEIPRSIRAHHLSKIFSTTHDVSIICFKSWLRKSKVKGVKVHRLEYGFLSKHLYNPYEANKSIKGIITPYLVFLFNQFFGFPDPWKTEITNLKNYILKNISVPNIIIFSVKPFSLAQMVKSFKQKEGWKDVKIILDIGDPLAHNAANKTFKKKHVQYEQQILSYADKIVVTNNATAEHYSSVYNISRKKIAVIPQGVDTKLFANSQIHKRDNTKIKLIYAGAFYPELRDPKYFIEAIDMLTTNLNLEVNLYADISPWALKFKNDYIKTHNRITQKELSLKYKESNYLLFFDNGYGMQTSGKVYELLSLKKPILFIYSNEASVLKKELASYEHVFFVKNNTACIKEMITNILNSKPFFKYHYDIEGFSWKTRAQDFLNEINELG